jgi:hypothetical protein
MDMGHTWMHMGEHGWHVGWKFIEKLIWVMCPMGINKNKILHYFSICSTPILGTYFCYDLIMLLSCFWNIYFLHSHCASIVFFHFILLFHDLNLKLDPFFFMFFLCLWHTRHFFTNLNSYVSTIKIHSLTLVVWIEITYHLAPIA